MKFYHGSKNELDLNECLFKNRDGYTEYEEVVSIENAFEAFKPEHMISRKDALYVVRDLDSIDYVGAYDDYIYEVDLDEYEKSDLSWYTEVSLEMGDFFDIKELSAKAIVCIKNYWSGEPSQNPVWEYRTESFTPIEIIENNCSQENNHSQKSKLKSKI